MKIIKKKLQIKFFIKFLPFTKRSIAVSVFLNFQEKFFFWSPFFFSNFQILKSCHGIGFWEKNPQENWDKFFPSYHEVDFSSKKREGKTKFFISNFFYKQKKIFSNKEKILMISF